MSDYDQSTKFAEADGLVDYVKLLFLTDLGEGHMEIFEQGETFDFDSEFKVVSIDKRLPFHIYTSSNQQVNNNLTRKIKYRDDVPIIRQYFLSHNDFRGPPILV